MNFEEFIQVIVMLSRNLPWIDLLSSFAHFGPFSWRFNKHTRWARMKKYGRLLCQSCCYWWCRWLLSVILLLIKRSEETRIRCFGERWNHEDNNSEHPNNKNNNEELFDEEERNGIKKGRFLFWETRDKQEEKGGNGKEDAKNKKSDKRAPILTRLPEPWSTSSMEGM